MMKAVTDKNTESRNEIETVEVISEEVSEEVSGGVSEEVSEEVSGGVSGGVSEEEEIYKENIIDHYKYPRNKRQMEKATVQHREYNPLCGDDLTLFLKIEEGTIVDVSFIGDGCAINLASVSMLTDYVKGRKIEEVKQVTKEDILNLLGIPISHARMKCALLSLKALMGGVKH